MKPKDLKPPFSWKERYVLFEGGVLYVPERLSYDELELPHFDSIEYCSGNGDWIIEKAEESPDIQWLAVEKRFDRVRKIWSKRENRGLTNLTIACGKAETITEHFLAPGSARRIYINFPDPWPKDRHAKHRIFQQPFIEQMARILRPEGELICATDDVDYSGQILNEVLGSNRFISLFDPPIQSQWPGYGGSYFRDLWERLGRQIAFFRFQKS